MSKAIKEMEMQALRTAFGGVRDLVLLSIKGLSAQNEHALRMALRKKNIRLRMVKNSLVRRVLGELGVQADGGPYWEGPTTVAWGAASAAELSRTLESELKAPKTAPLYKDKVVIKGGIADGQPIPFSRMVTLPTRTEAVARVVNLVLSPASRLVGQILGPASRVVGQIKTKGEGKEGEGAPAEAAAAPPA